MLTNDVDTAADALLLASRALVAVAARSLADAETVTLPQFRALVVLTRPVPVTVSDLAEELDIHPSTATRACDRLVRKRLIRRVPRVSGDRREVTLLLTAGGRRLVERVTERRRRDLAAIAGRMSAADRQHALLGLQAFAAAAGQVVSLDAFGWVDGTGVATAQPAPRADHVRVRS